MPLVDLPPYKSPPPTKYSLDCAPLTVIDLSTFDHSLEDRARLVDQLRDAAHNTGFWVVTGHGITDDEVNRQLSIGQAFYDTPLEDKREYPCNFAEGRSVLFNARYNVQKSQLQGIVTWGIVNLSVSSLTQTSRKITNQYVFHSSCPTFEDLSIVNAAEHCQIHRFWMSFSPSLFYGPLPV